MIDPMGKKSPGAKTVAKLTSNTPAADAARAVAPPAPRPGKPSSLLDTRYNNMRFASTEAVEKKWLKLGEVHKNRTFKQAATEFYDACAVVIKRCEALCHK